MRPESLSLLEAGPTNEETGADSVDPTPHPPHPVDTTRASSRRVSVSLHHPSPPRNTPRGLRASRTRSVVAPPSPPGFSSSLFLEGVEGSDVLPRLQCDFSVRLFDFKCDWCILCEWGEWGIITQLPGRGGASAQRDGGSGFVRRTRPGRYGRLARRLSRLCG